MTGDGEPWRIGVLEDNAPVRDYFLDILNDAEGLCVVGTASRLVDAPSLLDQRPHLILADLSLPDGNALDFIPMIKAAGVQCLVITILADRETVIAALRAGADGYLLKDSTTQTVLDSVRATLDGGAPISAPAAAFLLESFRTPTPGAQPEEPVGERLTPRETELLTLFSRGHSYKSAARDLGISPLTVGDHVKTIYRKLEVNSRGAAVFTAVQRGQLTL